MTEINKERRLEFADQWVSAKLVENVHSYAATGIIVNLSHHPLVLGGDVQTVIPPWKSAKLQNSVIGHAERVAIFDVPVVTNIGGLTFGEWDWFGNRFEKFPRTTPLYISRYDWIGETTANPFRFSNTASDIVENDDYGIRLNLWWSPAVTDCFIHNEHPFLEVHTQIFGNGRIQIFNERDASTLCREIIMVPGLTHDPFVQVSGKREWRYPWHRYWSDTDCIWLAIELHPKD